MRAIPLTVANEAALSSQGERDPFNAGLSVSAVLPVYRGISIQLKPDSNLLPFVAEIMNSYSVFQSAENTFLIAPLILQYFGQFLGVKVL